MRLQMIFSSFILTLKHIFYTEMFHIRKYFIRILMLNVNMPKEPETIEEIYVCLSLISPSHKNLSPGNKLCFRIIVANIVFVYNQKRIEQYA